MALAGQVEHPERLNTQEVTFQSDGFGIQGYLARPREGGPHPGIIIVHEAFGLVEHEKDVARRFANAGFIALALDLYSRVGAPKPDDMAALMPKMFGLEDRQTVRDLEAAAAYIRAQNGSNGKVGCVGFCMGGRATLLFACSSNKVDAAIDCWGGFITSATLEAASTPARPTPVIDLSDRLNCPLYVVIGGTDQNPSPAHGEQLKSRLERAGKSKLATFEVFDNAGHAFFADYRPSYNESAAFKLWPKMVSFFKTNLS